MEKRKPGQPSNASNYGSWENERRAELREKASRGEELSHRERMSLAADSVEEDER